MESLKDRDIHGVTHTELIEHWHNGDQDEVIDNLARRHAGIGVTLIVQAAQDKSLSLEDSNAIANRLMDHFTQLRDNYGITATERRLQKAELG